MSSKALAFTPRKLSDDPRQWKGELGLMNVETTTVAITLEGLMLWLKTLNVEVDPNLTELRLLPKYAQIGQLDNNAPSAVAPTSILDATTAPSADQQQSTLAETESAHLDVDNKGPLMVSPIEGFVPTRRVREPIGGGSANIQALFGSDDADVSVTSSAPAAPRDASQNSASRASNSIPTLSRESGTRLHEAIVSGTTDRIPAAFIASNDVPTSSLTLGNGTEVKQKVPTSSLPSNSYTLRQTSQLDALLTIVRDRTTQRGAFIFYSDRIIRLLVEEGLNHLPVVDKSVETPTGAAYNGVGFCGKIAGVSSALILPVQSLFRWLIPIHSLVMRAGEAMEAGLRECCRSVRIGKILIQRV
ncbi:hypothetical protein EMMF5_005293 [Cystobasidiomycetes sp. EMM_F5]